MAYRLKTISFVLLIISGGLGYLVLGTAQAGAQECLLRIEKDASPANDFPFNFVVTGDFTTEFSLFDPTDAAIILGLSVDQTITITEDASPGWTLESIECTEGVTDCGPPGQFIPCLDITINEDGITATCLDGDEGNCVFTNVVEPSHIPTLSEWGLITMAAVIGAAGVFMALRRRKAAV